MSHCQACNVFRNPRTHGGTHVAELKIVYEKAPHRIELHVCRCCWFAIAFKGYDMRREAECPGQIGQVYVYPMAGNPDSWYMQIIRQRRDTLEKILQESMDLMKKSEEL